MPFAYKANGVLLGTITIVLSGFTAGFGLYLQGVSSEFVPAGHASYFSLARITYPSLAVLFDIAIAIKCFGVGVSYLIIIGDLMPQIIQSLNISMPLLQERNFWVSVSMGIVGPLSFLRKLDSLKYTSVVSLVFLGYLGVVVVGHFLLGDTSAKRGPVRLVTPAGVSSVLQTLPIYVFAFTCHQNMFSVLNELAAATEKKYRRILGTSVIGAGCFYGLVGLTGYLSFGDNVGGNIIGMCKYSDCLIVCLFFICCCSRTAWASDPFKVEGTYQQIRR
jgi:amino acid permease